MTTKTEVIPINVQADFDKNDLVTVAVARGEALMRKELKTKMALIDETRENHEKLYKEYNASFKSMKNPFEKYVKPLNEILKTIDKHLKVTIDALPYSRTRSEISERKPKEAAIFSITLTGGQTLKTKVTNLNKTQNDMLKKIAEHVDTISDLEDEAIELKRRLSDIPTLERQMRAKVVEHHLEQSIDGKKLLDRLTSEITLDPAIKLLGV